VEYSKLQFKDVNILCQREFFDNSRLKGKESAVSDFQRSGNGMAWVFRGIRTLGDMALAGPVATFYHFSRPQSLYI
jgi:hypothetical protein